VTGDQGGLALANGSRRQQPLDDQLIGAMARAGEERASNQARPKEVRLMKVKVKVEDPQLAAG